VKRLLLCLMMLATVCSAGSAAPELGATPSIFRNWTIAFVRDHSIWTARGDGANQKLVIKHAEVPCWSPDKKKLAFYRDGNIWIADENGKNQRQLTHYGKHHAYRADDIRISWNARTGGITFSTPQTLLVSTERGACDTQGMSIFDLYPVLSGKSILSSRFDVADSGASFNFTDNENPAWSRDGKILAFTRNGDIWVATYVPEDKDGDRAGWDIRRLAAVARYDSPTYRCSRWNVGVTDLSWSPDGKSLAYCLERIGGSGQNDLHVIAVRWAVTPVLTVAADRVLLNIDTPTHGDHYLQPQHASFSPDGNWILFASLDDVSTLYAISLNGKSIAGIIRTASRPVW
jgi:WD40 repeat protein